MMQPVRNAENYPTCEVTAISMNSNIYEGLVIFMTKESLIQKKRKKKKRLQARKEYFSFVSAALKILVFSTVLRKYFLQLFLLI